MPQLATPTALCIAAALCAVADGASTVLALMHGGVERNPLIGPQPGAGLLAALTAIKAAAPFALLLARGAWRIAALVAACGVWAGAAANNILVASPAPDPWPALLGLYAAGLMAAIAAHDAHHPARSRL